MSIWDWTKVIAGVTVVCACFWLLVVGGLGDVTDVDVILIVILIVGFIFPRPTLDDWRNSI